MPFSPDDLERLPGMIPFEALSAKRREEDFRDFRKYLVDTGAVSCLVELYKHTAKKELGQDNPRLLKDFLASYEDLSPAVKESVFLTRENSTLREYNSQLSTQIEEMEHELRRRQSILLAKNLWAALAAPDFWTGRDGCGAAMSGALSLGQMYERFFGRKQDTKTGVVLADLLMPELLQGIGVSDIAVTMEAFVEWVVEAMPDDLRRSCSESLVPILVEGDSKVPPFEAGLLKELMSSPLYPKRLDELGQRIAIDLVLQAFLEAAVRTFACASDE